LLLLMSYSVAMEMEWTPNIKRGVISWTVYLIMIVSVVLLLCGMMYKALWYTLKWVLDQIENFVDGDWFILYVRRIGVARIIGGRRFRWKRKKERVISKKEIKNKACVVKRRDEAEANLDAKKRISKKGEKRGGVNVNNKVADTHVGNRLQRGIKNQGLTCFMNAGTWFCLRVNEKNNYRSGDLKLWELLDKISRGEESTRDEIMSELNRRNWMNEHGGDAAEIISNGID